MFIISLIFRNIHSIILDGNHYFLDTIIQGYDSLENIKNEVKFFGGAVSMNMAI